jgi:hypothetical protein
MAFDRVGPRIKVSPVFLRLPHGTTPQVSLRLQHGIPCQSKSSTAPVRTQVWAEYDDTTLHSDMPHTAMASSSPWAICPPHWHTTLAHHSGRCWIWDAAANGRCSSQPTLLIHPFHCMRPETSWESLGKSRIPRTLPRFAATTSSNLSCCIAGFVRLVSTHRIGSAHSTRYSSSKTRAWHIQNGPSPCQPATSYRTAQGNLILSPLTLLSIAYKLISVSVTSKSSCNVDGTSHAVGTIAINTKLQSKDIYSSRVPSADTIVPDLEVFSVYIRGCRFLSRTTYSSRHSIWAFNPRLPIPHSTSYSTPQHHDRFDSNFTWPGP